MVHVNYWIPCVIYKSWPCMPVFNMILMVCTKYTTQCMVNTHPYFVSFWVFFCLKCWHDTWRFSHSFVTMRMIVVSLQWWGGKMEKVRDVESPRWSWTAMLDILFRVCNPLLHMWRLEVDIRWKQDISWNLNNIIWLDWPLDPHLCLPNTRSM